MKPAIRLLSFLLCAALCGPAMFPPVALSGSTESGQAPSQAAPTQGKQGPNVQDLEVGQQYEANTRVRVSLFGVSFVVPTGWLGGVPPGSEAFLLGSNEKPGVGLVVFLLHVTPEDLAAKLQEPQVLGEGLVLQPAGPVNTAKARSTASYLSQDHVGRAVGISGPDRQGIIFFFAGPKTEGSNFERLLEQLSASTQFQPVDSSRAVQQWRAFLAGMMLKYLSSYSSGHSGGYSSTAVWHLCRDGQFYYSSSSSVSVDVPGASGSSGDRQQREGVWGLEVKGMEALLVLTDREGTQTRHRIDFDGKQTLLDGQRVFRVTSDHCP